MRREKRYHDSKWESNWVRCYEGGQTDQGKGLDDCCHVTSALGLSAHDFCFRNSPLVTLLQLPLSLDASSVERGIFEVGTW